MLPTDGRTLCSRRRCSKAVVNVIKRDHPDREVKGSKRRRFLKECHQLLKLSTLGKYPGYLLEGMACPGGCIVTGAGTIVAIKKSWPDFCRIVCKTVYHLNIRVKLKVYQGA